MQESNPKECRPEKPKRRKSFDFSCLVRIIRLFGMLDLIICLLNREMKERALLRQRAKAHCIYKLQRDLYDELRELFEDTRSFFELGVVNGWVNYQSHQLDLSYEKMLKNQIAMSINIYHHTVKRIDQKYQGWLTPSELYCDLAES